MPRPDKLHDELDALLDGRPVELTEDLAPLVEAADVLRAELAGYELDPEVADRHLEQVLQGSATVVALPVRPQPSGWELRRRVVAIALAAALVLAPATMASAASLPGQPMYPFKLAIEQLRLASVQWSPTREAGERTRLADERLGELDRLVNLEMFSQVPPAIRALNRAVQAAHRAVEDAVEDGADTKAVATLTGKLKAVKAARQVELGALVSKLPLTLTDKTYTAIVAAVQQQPPLVDPGRDPAGAPAAKPPPSTAGPPASAPSNTTGPQPPPTTAEPPPTSGPEPGPTTTTIPPTTTAPPTSATTQETTGTGTEGTSATVGQEQERAAEEAAAGQLPPASSGTP
jgi:uncharacterized protein DUF5667